VEYIPDPPDGEAVNVAVCPLSIVTGETRTDNAVLTVTVTAEDVTVTGVEELSFTIISNDQMPLVDRMPVETVGAPPALQANEEPKSL
jgi:hypothetical protein